MAIIRGPVLAWFGITTYVQVPFVNVGIPPQALD